MSDKKQPLVSFIVTCYNLPHDMVKECLDSIINLSLRKAEREIILIDDGSDTDPLASLNDERNEIMYIRQKNGGLSSARNTGLRMATGKYIQFVDGDDRLVTEAYERCLDVVRYNEPDLVLFDSTDSDKVRINYELPEPMDGAHYMRHNNIHAVAWGYIFNRRILGNLRFTPGTLHEDEEFTPQLILHAEKVYSLNITAYYYRKRQGSITNNVNKRNIIKRLNDVEQIITHLNYLADILPAGDKSAMKRRVAQLTMDYIYNTIVLTRSARQIEKRISRLETKGLFPLPDANYTTKYTIFRHLSKNRIIRMFLKKFISRL